MTRTGKITRLPLAIREELNRRLADGERGVRLVAWLNTLPEVHRVLAAGFGGRPINQVNLTEWKRGGFEDWLRREERHDWAAHFVEQSDELEQQSSAIPLAERTGTPVALALSRLLQLAVHTKDPTKQTHTIIALAHQLTQVRRANHSFEKSRFDQKRRAVDQQKAIQLDQPLAATHHLGTPATPER